ncbi:hypothetical protein CVS30_14485 [Arthrobacter psychrolactophilus]|uniref:SipW-cognate class signal peptide n=1 Tax=Arthrobacter psychrolactophilus TaxID=92442 RepID=A0A2V5ILX3_9MICC|nr:hypothetical protein [Arthrobacter psychrolactophilus]PYI37605.1 hypothetical protein CVS30_14485 [Arthrobacter psychrolactophilus]
MKRTQSARRSMQIKAMLSLGMLVGLGAVSTLASWTGGATATAHITAATVSLGIGGTAGGATTYTVPITGSNWYPGMSQAQKLVVTNTSTVAVPYSISGSFTDVPAAGLGLAMTLLVSDGAVQGTTSNATCSGAQILKKDAMAAFTAPVNRGSLAAGASDTFCVQYQLPLGAANTLQGATTSMTLTFTATVGS